jgi:hypothetical protein
MAKRNSTEAARKLKEECEFIAQRERVIHEFPVGDGHGNPVPVQPPKPHPDEIAEKTLDEFRKAGVPAELLDDDDFYEVTGPDGAVEGGVCDPLLSATERVQRVLAVLAEDSRRASELQKQGEATGGNRHTSKETAEAMIVNMRAVEALAAWEHLPKPRARGRVTAAREYLAQNKIVQRDASDSWIKARLAECIRLSAEREAESSSQPISSPSSP